MTDTYLTKILDKVHEERGLDFSGYRENLLSRRVKTRVRAVKRTTFEEYFAYLKFHPEEMDNLLDVLTINVTEFFRDGHVFDVIEKRVIPDLFEKKRMTHDAQRMTIWSCACSSGEEPYSILMLVTDHLRSKLIDHDLSIIATDIDQQSLTAATQGVYEESQFKNVSPERMSLIENYFYKIGHKYWIREDWPPYINFQYHDVIADIPFNHVDMILCRNMLMYFDRDLQNQVIRRFYDALNPGGFLILGVVESLMGEIKEKFIEYDAKARIYLKK